MSSVPPLSKNGQSMLAFPAISPAVRWRSTRAANPGAIAASKPSCRTGGPG